MQIKDWDRMLPYLLFAYREVPQSSTGVSPFEVLYGQDLTVPLIVFNKRNGHGRLEQEVMRRLIGVSYWKHKEG